MRSTAIVLIALLTLGSGNAFAQEEAAAWRKVAEGIPLGSKVRVQTIEGKRFSGTLMRVDGNEVLVKKNTRRPEPAVSVGYADMAKIEGDKDGSGFNIGKAIAIGLAAGGGAMLTLILFAMQWD